MGSDRRSPVQLVPCEDPDENFESVKIGTGAYDDGRCGDGRCIYMGR